MKHLKKKLRQRTVEAYANDCGTPEDCLVGCFNFDAMQGGIIAIAGQIA